MFFINTSYDILFTFNIFLTFIEYLFKIYDYNTKYNTYKSYNIIALKKYHSFSKHY